MTATESESQVSISDDDGRLLTLDEAAPMLKVSRRTLERWIQRGEFPAARLGGRGGTLRTLVWADDVHHAWQKRRSENLSEARKRRRQSKGKS